MSEGTLPHVAVHKIVDGEVYWILRLGQIRFPKTLCLKTFENSVSQHV